MKRTSQCRGSIPALALIGGVAAVGSGSATRDPERRRPDSQLLARAHATDPATGRYRRVTEP